MEQEEHTKLMSDVREDPLYRRALECTRTELSIKRESLCLCAMRCWALRLFPFQLACFRPVVVVVVCARAERRAWVALLDAERFADVLLFLMCVAGVRQTTTPSSRRVQWCLPRHWRAGSASCRALVSYVSLCVSAPCAERLFPFRLACFPPAVVCVCVWSGGRGWRFCMLRGLRLS